MIFYLLAHHYVCGCGGFHLIVLLYESIE